MCDIQGMISVSTLGEERKKERRKEDNEQAPIPPSAGGSESASIVSSWFLVAVEVFLECILTVRKDSRQDIYIYRHVYAHNITSLTIKHSY